MKIIDIEKLFEDENNLDVVLEGCKEDFKKINYWADLMRNGVVNDNPSEISNALAELAGAYANLRIILGIAETEKRNRQVRFKETIRIETENADKKYVDTKAETQASAHVAKYRRIRNMVNAYKEAAQQMMGVLQNINNNLEKELKRNPLPKE